MSKQVFRAITLAVAILLAMLLPAGAAATTGTRAAQQPGLRGSHPFLVVLCRFAISATTGAPKVEVQRPSYFANLLTGAAPSLDDYWRTVSGGRIDLAGSKVTGWYVLPKGEKAYVRADGRADIAAAAADCLSLATAENLAAYSGIVAVFDENLESRPLSARLCANLQGSRQCFQVIWMWPAWMHAMPAWVHEMGHSFGLDHSSDASGSAYANPWDVMSGFSGCPTPQYPIVDQMDRLSWITGERKVVAPQDGTITIDLQSPAMNDGKGVQVIQAPDETGTGYYTVEARARIGYDEQLPGAAVLIHYVDPADTDHPAHLVSHPGEPLTAAAGMWRPGDVFSDASGQVAISVDSASGNGFRVTVRTGKASQTLPSVQDTQAGGAAGIAISRWTPSAPLLGVAAGASGVIYVVTAKTTKLGVSPAIEALTWEGGRWQDPETLTSGWSSMPGDAPALTVAGDNTAFVAWSGAGRPFPTMSSGNSNSDIWVASRGMTGGWGAAIRVNDDTGSANQLSPALAASAAGQLYAAWEDQRDGNRDVYFAELANGRPVGTNRRINDDAGRESQGSPAIAADIAGNVHLLWVDRRNGAGEIWAASRAANGQWGRNVRLAAAGLDVYEAPAVTVDGRGNAYAAWIAYPACGRENSEVGTLMAAFRPAGGDWQPAEAVAEAVHGGRASRPVIAANAAGRVYLAWEEREGAGIAIRMARRAAEGGWSSGGQRVAVSGAKAPSKPALAVDQAGTVYLAWLAKDGGAEYATMTQ
jgi:hypothetical protein